MLSIRQEITNYSRSCERLISAATSTGNTPFSQDEIQLIAYYAGEMMNLVDNLQRDGKHLIDQ